MIVIDEQKCVGCGQCVADCVFHNLTVAQGKAHVRALRGHLPGAGGLHPRV